MKKDLYQHGSKKQISVLQSLLMMLALILVIGSAGQTAPAQAASNKSETTFNFDIATSELPDPLCAHTNYRLEYFARVDRVADVNGEQVDLKGGSGPPNMAVRGSSSNTDIAELNPEVAKLSTLQNSIGIHSADFVLKTGGIGSATLTLKGAVAWAGDNVILAPLELPVRVVNCNFRVTMNYSVQQSGPGYFSILYGRLDTLLTGDEGVFQGAGILDTTRTASVSGCSFSSTGYLNPTTLTATRGTAPDDTELELKIKFEPGSHTDLISCPYGGGGGTESVDPTGYLVTSATFPDTGATKSFPVSFAGWSGTLLITVEPVDESAK